MFGLFNRKKGVVGLVGVSWHDQHLSFAHVQQRAGNPVLLRCESLEAPSQKQAGKILGDKVKALNLSGARCNFVLAPEDYSLLLVEAPAVEDAELAAAAKWKIKDMVDRPLEQLAISVFRVPREAYRNQRDMLYVVAADRKRVQQAVDLVHDAGLTLESIDIPELAILNVLVLCADDNNGLALIDLRFSGSLLNLCRNGNILLTRHLNTQVADDIAGNAEWETVRERLVLEIQRSLDYYESQMGQGHINRLLLAPRKHDSETLVAQLSQAMGVKVEALDLGGTEFVINEDDDGTILDVDHLLEYKILEDNPANDAGVLMAGDVAALRNTAVAATTLASGETRETGSADVPFWFTAPGEGLEGSLLMEFDLQAADLHFLRYDWRGATDDADVNADAVYTDNPRALLEFGTYRGNSRIINWQELFINE